MSRKIEAEVDYVFPEGRANDPRAWGSERMYFLGEDSADPSAIMVTPSGNATRQAEAPWYQTLIQTAVPAISTLYAQREMTKLNLARINKGQPPLTAQQYAAVYQPPSAQVQFGATADTKKLMLYAALGVAALVGLRAAKVI